MAEYIERTERLTLAMNAGARAIENNKQLSGSIYVVDVFSDNPKEISYYEAANLLREVAEAPTAEVEPVRHGEWTKSEDDWNSLTTITCSECHEEWCFETEEDVSLLNYRYCPNCGARMDLGGAENG